MQRKNIWVFSSVHTKKTECSLSSMDALWHYRHHFFFTEWALSCGFHATQTIFGHTITRRVLLHQSFLRSLTHKSSQEGKVYIDGEEKHTRLQGHPNNVIKQTQTSSMTGAVTQAFQRLFQGVPTSKETSQL